MTECYLEPTPADEEGIDLRAEEGGFYLDNAGAKTVLKTRFALEQSLKENRALEQRMKDWVSADEPGVFDVLAHPFFWIVVGGVTAGALAGGIGIGHELARPR